jgi:hypothetical protein
MFLPPATLDKHTGLNHTFTGLLSSNERGIIRIEQNAIRVDEADQGDRDDS